jgi:hypothetical protein
MSLEGGGEGGAGDGQWWHRLQATAGATAELDSPRENCTGAASVALPERRVRVRAPPRAEGKGEGGRGGDVAGLLGGEAVVGGWARVGRGRAMTHSCSR